MNKSFQLSLKKLDQIIGIPPPSVYTKKNSIHTGCISLSNLANSFTIQKKSDFARNKSSTLITPNTSYSKLRKFSFESLFNKTGNGLSQEEKSQIYQAKCKDLSIPPVLQLERRFVDYLDRVIHSRTINLTDNRLGPITAEVLGKILKKNSNFSKLELSKNMLGDKGIIALIRQIKDNKSLIHISIGNNDIRADGANEFFKLLVSNESIISVDLSSTDGLNKNRIGMIGIAPIREVLMHNPFIRYLDLADSQIGNDAIMFITEGLRENRTLEYLSLAGNSFSGRAFKEFLQSAALSELYDLILSGNRLANEGAEFIGEFLAGTSFVRTKLKTLDVSNNDITYKGSSKIFSGITQNTSLVALNIENNPLSENAGNGLSYCLEENNTLQTINLSSCQLREAGIIKLCDALTKNRSLKTLIIKHNSLKDQGAFFISEALAMNTSLLNLDISYNQITKVGATHLFTSIKRNISLYSLVLTGNMLKDDFCQFMMDCIRHKSNFQVLKVNENQITTRFLKQIAQVLEKNKNLYRDFVAQTLKREIGEMAKRDFNTEKIHKAIDEKKREKVEMSKRLEVHKKTVEEIKANLDVKMAEIHEEYMAVHRIKDKVSEELGIIEYDLAMEKQRYERRIGKMHSDVVGINLEIENLQSKSTF